MNRYIQRILITFHEKQNQLNQVKINILNSIGTQDVCTNVGLTIPYKMLTA